MLRKAYYKGVCRNCGRVIDRVFTGKTLFYCKRCRDLVKSWQNIVCLRKRLKKLKEGKKK